MRPQSAKAKGQRAAREVKQAFLTAYPLLAPDDIQVVPSGVNGVDVRLSPAAQAQLPFAVAIEVKNQEKLNIWQALAQARRNAVKGQTPVLLFRRNHEELHIAFSLAAFVQYLQGVKGG